MGSASILRFRAPRSLLAGLALLAVGLLFLASAPAGARAEGPAASLSPFSPHSTAQTHAPSSTPSHGTAPQAAIDQGDGTLAARFIGFIYRDEQDDLATHIRATGITARGETVNCGTADVEVLDSGFGFYQLLVLGDAAREGCPRPGDQVSFRLLSGSIDDGVRVHTSNDTTFTPGGTSVVTLYPTTDRSTANRWSGDTSGKFARLTWIGSDGTSITDALAALDRPVDRAWRWDAANGRFLVYTPGTPASLQTLNVVNLHDKIGVRFE